MPTVDDLRAEIARRRVPLYKLAATLSVHPGRLGMILNGKFPLSPKLAGRIMAALEQRELAAK